MNDAMPPALAFAFFEAASFIILRLAVNTLARMERAAWAGPVLILVGAASGAYFFRLSLHQYFIWHLAIFMLVILSWHTKSRVNEKKLQQIGGANAGGARASQDVVQSYTMTRRLLSFGMVSYLAAFSAAYYYLFTHR